MIAAMHRKLGPTARARRKKAARDGRYGRTIRAQVAERDGYCRVMRQGWRSIIEGILGSCAGASEWAHWDDKKRFKTRGLPPEERHTTAESLMLCTKHHDQFDGRRFPRLAITCTTDRGCDGPLRMETR